MSVHFFNLLKNKPLWCLHHGKEFRRVIEPEDLPVAVHNIHAFGGKAEKRMSRVSISIYFSIAVTKKLSTK
jgi:hypothetical protein